MPTDDARGEIVELLVMHEKILAELYLLYADRYYEHGEFWMQLHHEENLHVELIRSLDEHVAQGAAVFNPDRLHVGALRAIVQYARSVVTYAKKQAPTLVTAVTMAMDLEDSMVEKGIFAVFVADSPETRRAFEQMTVTFTEHFKRLELFLALVHPKKKMEVLQ